MKESTRNILRLHGWRVDRAVHNYVYFSYYDRYVTVFLRLMDLVRRRFTGTRLSARLFKLVSDRYHAKVITLEDAGKILSLKEDVVLGPDTTERIIPYPYATSIILKEPQYIAVMDCPCRRARGDAGCRPLDVCMAVGRTNAQFWLEHGARYHARRVTQQEALRILEEAHGRGNIITSYFKVATGGRTGIICCCCTCCCGGLEAAGLVKKLKGGRQLSNITASGYVAVVDEEKCSGCGTCADLCFFSAARMEGGVMVQDPELCMGCGLCVDRCPVGARTLFADPAGLLPLDIDLAKEMLGAD